MDFQASSITNKKEIYTCNSSSYNISHTECLFNDRSANLYLFEDVTYIFEHERVVKEAQLSEMMNGALNHELRNPLNTLSITIDELCSKVAEKTVDRAGIINLIKSATFST